MGEVERNVACPSCKSIGKDSTDNHLMLFADESGGHCPRCKYTMGPDGNVTHWGHLEPDEEPVVGLSPETALPLAVGKLSVSETHGFIGGITPATTTKYGVTTTTEDHEVTHHYYPVKKKGKLLTHKIKEVATKKFYRTKKLGKGTQTDFFGEDTIRGVPDVLLITEGEVDAMAASQMLGVYACDVVSLPDGANIDVIKYKMKWLLKIPTVILCFDQDEVGQDAVDKVWELLPEVKVMTYEEKDAFDMLQAGKEREFKDAYVKAGRYVPRTVLTVGDLDLSDPVPLGLTYPWVKLTELTYGIQLNQVVGIGAAPGCGKSTFIKGIQAHLMFEHGEPIGIVSLEESQALSVRLLVGYLMNEQIHLPGAVYDGREANKILKSLDDKAFCYDHRYYQGKWLEIENFIRYLYSQGVRYFFIDPISALVSHLSASEANKYLSGAMYSMSKLVQALDITVFHCNHLNSNSTGLSHEEGGRVYGSSFTGSRSQYRYSNLLLGLSRNQLSEDEDERDVMACSIIKDRLTGSTGKHCILNYNRFTGRLIEPVTGVVH